MHSLTPTRVVIGIILFFFAVNVLWVKLDKFVPSIGDDARFLQGSWELAEPLRQGNIAEFADRWQHAFIHPDRYPRTPLFALLAVPAFFVFGPNEDAAIISNLVVLAASSFLLYLLIKELFKGASSQRINTIAVCSVVIFNLLPGIYGFARLYMSEIMQAFFVLLIALMVARFRSSKDWRFFVGFGVVMGLGVLLRFILPLYSFFTLLVFVISQLQLRQPWQYYLKVLVLMGIGFFPVALTWYGQNFTTYYEFAKYTSSGDLTKYYSLGPVSSPLTALRFWYVIIIYELGWPFVLAVAGVVLAVVCLLRKQVQIKIKTYAAAVKKHTWKKLLPLLSHPVVYLLILPLPALAATTLTEGKTARYFVPVIVFWVVIFTYGLALLREKLTLRVFAGVLAVVLLAIGYQFIQSILPFLPHLPKSSGNHASGAFDLTTDSAERYQYFFGFFAELGPGQGDIAIYNTAEQTVFNDAELIWYGTQHGYSLVTTDEFSRYTDISKGIAKINQAGVVIVDTDPESGPLWVDKYRQIREYALEQKDFVTVSQKQMSNGSTMIILLRIKDNA